MLTYILELVLTIQMYSCKPSYREYIPNGYIVPNPCVSPGVWDAVGHYNPLHHTLTKNQFGADYGSETRWSHRLCHLDSDRDGRTNGEELGDPDCYWFVGEIPAHKPIGHPGICEPVGSALCIMEQGFTCNDLENSANLKP